MNFILRHIKCLACDWHYYYLQHQNSQAITLLKMCFKKKVSQAENIFEKQWKFSPIKLLEENRQNILWHKSYQCFLRSVSQGNRNKTKSKQLKPNQTCKNLHRKGKHKQNEETTYGLGDNFCKQWDQQRLNFQNL